MKKALIFMLAFAGFMLLSPAAYADYEGKGITDLDNLLTMIHSFNDSVRVGVTPTAQQKQVIDIVQVVQSEIGNKTELTGTEFLCEAAKEADYDNDVFPQASDAASLYERLVANCNYEYTMSDYVKGKNKAGSGDICFILKDNKIEDCKIIAATSPSEFLTVGVTDGTVSTRTYTKHSLDELKIINISYPEHKYKSDIAFRFFGNTPEEITFNFLVDYTGLCPAAVCGIMGNIYCECEFNEEIYGNEEGFWDVYSKSSGLCMWKNEYFGNYAFAEALGAKWGDLQTQLRFLHYTLTSPSSENSETFIPLYHNLLGLPNSEESVKTAAELFCREYERCARMDEAIPKRQSAGLRYYQQFNK